MKRWDRGTVLRHARAEARLPARQVFGRGLCALVGLVGVLSPCGTFAPSLVQAVGGVRLADYGLVYAALVAPNLLVFSAFTSASRC